MPTDLVLVRHGESEGNVASDAEKKGDLTVYTEQFTMTPGHRWRLTCAGRAQAAAIGGWIAGEFGSAGFDRYLVSPYVRARETAGLMALPAARWRINRALRERDFGDIGSLPREEFTKRKEWKRSVQVKRIDPLYWVAPNGESIAQVAEDRVRNLLGTFAREEAGRRVLAVTHGNWIDAARLVLERWSDEEFASRWADGSENIVNCQALHYSRRDPVKGETGPRLSWLRHARPVLRDKRWVVDVSEWQAVGVGSLSNEELLRGVELVPRVTTESCPT